MFRLASGRCCPCSGVSACHLVYVLPARAQESAAQQANSYSVCPRWRVITRKFDGVSVVESPLAFVAAVRRDLFTACRFVSVSNAYHHARAFRVGEIENLIDEGREEDLSALWQSLFKQFFIQTASRPDVPSTIFSAQFVNSGSSLPVPVQHFFPIAGFGI